MLRQSTGVKRCASSRTTTKSENFKETEEDELENQQLRAHALPEDEQQQDNELTGNQIEVRFVTYLSIAFCFYYTSCNEIYSNQLLID